MENGIEEVEVTTHRIKVKCPNCGGNVIFTGGCLTSNPPQYSHGCEDCIYQTYFKGETYPKIIYKEKLDK
jgi:predicted RNA-binding Zn-ribbon protein involved in translation (DUF1610 family)